MLRPTRSRERPTNCKADADAGRVNAGGSEGGNFGGGNVGGGGGGGGGRKGGDGGGHGEGAAGGGGGGGGGSGGGSAGGGDGDGGEDGGKWKKPIQSEIAPITSWLDSSDPSPILRANILPWLRAKPHAAAAACLFT